MNPVRRLAAATQALSILPNVHVSGTDNCSATGRQQISIRGVRVGYNSIPGDLETNAIATEPRRQAGAARALHWSGTRGPCAGAAPARSNGPSTILAGAGRSRCMCGRFLPISPVADQELGGLAMWAPGGVLFGCVFIGFLGRRFEMQGTAPARPAPGTAAPD